MDLEGQLVFSKLDVFWQDFQIESYDLSINKIYYKLYWYGPYIIYCTLNFEVILKLKYPFLNFFKSSLKYDGLNKPTSKHEKLQLSKEINEN